MYYRNIGWFLSNILIRWNLQTSSYSTFCPFNRSKCISQQGVVKNSHKNSFFRKLFKSANSQNQVKCFVTFGHILNDKETHDVIFARNSNEKCLHKRTSYYMQLYANFLFAQRSACLTIMMNHASGSGWRISIL